MLTLLIGGARSGKSRYGQSICAGGARVAYVATARAEDDEMRVRITRHRGERPVGWLTVEEPLAVAEVVKRLAGEMDFVLLDCLTLWLSNFCGERKGASPDELQISVSREIASLVAASARSHLVMVSNEVGSGIVPESYVGRLFRDLHGLANQQVARDADYVIHMVAGIPCRIKPMGERL